MPSLIKIIKGLKINYDARILDVGCGGGYVAGELSKLGFDQIWAFDASESGISVCRQSSPEIATHFAVHDVYDRHLPEAFPDTYDLVLSFEVIEHCISPATFMENIRSWLRPGGYLVLSTPYHGYWKNFALSLFDKWDKHHTVDWEGGHIKFFSKDTLFRLCGTIGLNPLYFLGSGRIPYLWKSMIAVAQKQ